MKIKELHEAKDQFGWEPRVHAILDKGDKAALLKKSDKDLVYLVQQAKDAGSLHYGNTKVILPFVQSWRAKESLTMKEEHVIDFPKVGPFGIDGTYWAAFKGSRTTAEKFVKYIISAGAKSVRTGQRGDESLVGWEKPFIDVDMWRKKGRPESVKEGVANAAKTALSLGDQTTMFTLQVRHDSGKWEDVGDGLLRHEAQEMLDDGIDDEVGVEYRAVSFDKKEVLRPKRKAQPKGKDVLARDASPEVHKRNADFFDKHL